MTVWRYRTKDIRPGDTVLYKPSWQPMTDWFIDNQLLATGTVTGAEQHINRMTVIVDWGEWPVPSVVDVNDVEVLTQGPDPA